MGRGHVATGAAEPLRRSGTRGSRAHESPFVFLSRPGRGEGGRTSASATHGASHLMIARPRPHKKHGPPASLTPPPPPPARTTTPAPLPRTADSPPPLPPRQGPRSTDSHTSPR